MADSSPIHPSIFVLIDLAIKRISSDEVHKFLSKQAKTSLLVDQLKHKLLSFKESLMDADHKAISSGRVLRLLDDLKDVMYDAENALDEIVIQASRSKSSSFKKVHRSILSCVIPSDERVDSEFMEILKRLDGIVEQASVLGLQGSNNKGQVLETKIPVGTSLMPQSKQCVGRDLEMKELIGIMDVEGLMKVNRKNEMVELDSDCIRVVLISGMSGVGKTALAQMLYNDERLDSVFDMKAWLPFQRDFHLSEAFKALYEVMFEHLWSVDMETIEKKLCSFLRGKRLLLVFDDVCFERFGSWEELLRPIRVAARGTTVIVTTCSDNASSVMQPPQGYSFHLKPLSDNDCWSIIKSIPFDNEQPLDETLEATGRQVAMKCKGLPLAAVMLGGALHSIPQQTKEWEALLKGPLWESIDEICGILPALRLSYDCLSNPELKLCFAYCSLFPKNYRFEREKLVLLWMAEGFLASNNTQTTTEELGNTYFNELVSKSFFQPKTGKETFYVMHNLIHDLAVSIFREFNPESDADSENKFRNTRQFSYVQTKYHDSGKFQALSNEKLRTFLPIRSISNGYFCYIPRMALSVVFPKWSCLRILCLSHYQITELPSSFDNLIHLRYLDLSFTRITKLPNSTRKLYKLQTLLLSNCGRLTSLPPELGSMISLRHLDISCTDSLQEMPHLIGRLKNLQTLSKFALGEDKGARISELNQLQSLKGALMITGLDNVDSLSSAKAANIKGKVFLDELVYQWNNHSTQEARICDELKPHVNLKRLTIYGFGGTKFPDWVGAPEYHNMVVLNLIDCCSCISLPPLGELPSLKHLCIEGLQKVIEVGPEFYGSSTDSSSVFAPFPSLETLKFKDMGSWRKWQLFQGEGLAFPMLNELCLDFCPALSGELPTNLPLLRKVDIRYYPELTNSLRKLPSIRSLTLKRCSPPDLHIVSDLTSLSCLNIDTPNKGTLSNMHISPYVENLEARLCSFESLCHTPTWLRSLSLSQCQNLGLKSSERYTYLRYLSITGADSLAAFHLNLFPNLVYLEIASCPNLESVLIPRGYAPKSLHDLSISDCHKLLNLPFNDLVSLQLMSIVNCSEIDTLSSFGLPPNLISLKISGCNKLISNRKNWQLHNLASLKQLQIGGNAYMETLESFPDDQFLLPTSVINLFINGFKNLKSLNSEGIQRLTSLEELKISGCPKLKGLPEDPMPPSLCYVDVSYSPQLELRCFFNREDWPKISHLPRVRVAGCEF